MAAREHKLEDYDQVLIVEGYSDLLFYAEMLEQAGKDVFIKELGGKSGLARKLEAFLTPTILASKEALAFIFDADQTPDETRTSLEALLSRLTGQTVMDGAWTTMKPRIGLMIVPGGSQQGEIESLVWRSWAGDPANDTQKRCIEDYVACMASQGKLAHSPDKGLIGALLAVKSDEDPRLGPGTRTKVFDLDRPELLPLRDFLSKF